MAHEGERARFDRLLVFSHRYSWQHIIEQRCGALNLGTVTTTPFWAERGDFEFWVEDLRFYQWP